MKASSVYQPKLRESSLRNQGPRDSSPPAPNGAGGLYIPKTPARLDAPFRFTNAHPASWPSQLLHSIEIRFPAPNQNQLKRMGGLLTAFPILAWRSTIFDPLAALAGAASPWLTHHATHSKADVTVMLAQPKVHYENRNQNHEAYLDKQSDVENCGIY